MDAKHWDNIYATEDRHPWSGAGTILPGFVDEYRPQPPVALDIGTGEGDKANWLAENGYEVFAIDISAKAVAKAQAKYRNPNIRFTALNAVEVDQLGLAGGSIGLVLDLASSQFMPASDQQAYARKVSSLLAPGGFLLYMGLKSIGNSPPWVKALDIPGDQAKKLWGNLQMVSEEVRVSQNLPDTESYCLIMAKPG